MSTPPEFPVLGNSYRVMWEENEPFYPCIPVVGSARYVTKLYKNDVVRAISFDDVLGARLVVLDIQGFKVMISADVCKDILHPVNIRSR